MDQLDAPDGAEIIAHYFKRLSVTQITLFNRLGLLYRYWNARINLVSRKDIAHLYLHHVLHSLSIAKVIDFSAHTKVLDLGTGGGFPGVPLAILFPEVTFHLVDAIAKKIKAVDAIVTALGLKNVTLSCVRGEHLKGKYDFIVGRAVANLDCFHSWIVDKIALEEKNSLPNGILYLKGVAVETLPLEMQCYPIRTFFKEPFFKEKYLLHGYKIIMP